MQMSSTDINHHVGAMFRVPSSSSLSSPSPSPLPSPASASLHNRVYCNREVPSLIPYPAGTMVNAVNSCLYDTSNGKNASLVDHLQQQQQQLHHFSANLQFLYSHSNNIPTEYIKTANQQNMLYQSILQRQQATEESSCNELQEADDADVDHMATKQLFPLKPDCEEKSDDHPCTSTTVNTSSNSVSKNNNAALNMNMNSNMNRTSFDCLNAGSSGASLSNLQSIPWLHQGLQPLPPPHNIAIPTMNPLSSILNTVQHVKKSRRGPRSRSSQYRGVTFYRRTGRWESHIWDCGRQVYLGGFDTAHDAARAYDKAAIKFRGFDADINFSLSHYENDIKLMSSVTKEELVQILRRQSTLISHGNSRVRGMLLQKCGRFGRKIAQFSPKGVYDQSDANQNVERTPVNPADCPNQELHKTENEVNDQSLELSLGTKLSNTEGNSKSEEAGKASTWYSSTMVFGGQDILKSCVPTKKAYPYQDSLNNFGKIHDANGHHEGPSDDLKQPLEHVVMWGKRSLLSSQRIADAEPIAKSRPSAQYRPSSRGGEANSSSKLPRLTSCSGQDESAGDFLSLSVGSTNAHTPSPSPPPYAHDLLTVGRVQQEESAAAFTSSTQSIYHAAAASSGFSPQQGFAFPKTGLNFMSSNYNPSLVIKSPVTDFLLASFNQPIKPKQR